MAITFDANSLPSTYGSAAYSSSSNLSSWTSADIKVLTSKQINALTPDILPKMDAEAAALGRSTSARSEMLEKR